MWLTIHTGKFVFRAPKILRCNFRQNISRQKSPSSETNMRHMRLAEPRGKRRRSEHCRGFWGILPRKIFEPRVSQMPFPEHWREDFAEFSWLTKRLNYTEVLSNMKLWLKILYYNYIGSFQKRSIPPPPPPTEEIENNPLPPFGHPWMVRPPALSTKHEWHKSFQTILLQRSVKAMAYCDFSTLFSNSSGVAEHLAASCEHKHVAGFVG
jgi:hypothetical protein